MLIQTAVNTSFNLVLLVGIPLLFYYAVHRRRHQRGIAEVMGRAGMRLGESRYLWYAAGGVVVVLLWIAVLPPDLEVITREGTVQHRFAGRGIDVDTVSSAALYALVQTGFSEEFLFRGLIAGSLGRRMSLVRANVLQAALFLAPHLLLLTIMPEHWPVLILVFIGALFAGWLRLRSGSIAGPWMLHGGANLVVTLSVLVRTMPP